MNFTSFEHETLASPELLKQQSYGHHQTYRHDASSDLDFFSLVDNVMDPTNMSHEQVKQALSANHKLMSHLPQLTPDNTEGNRTSSSVLSGHNPDYATMSPLHMPTNPENTDEFHTPLQTNTNFRGHDDMMSMMDEEVQLLNSESMRLLDVKTVSYQLILFLQSSELFYAFGVTCHNTCF